MKKILILSIATILSLVSCNKEQTIDDNNPQVQDNMEMEAFTARIDRLNSYYLEMNNTNLTKGYVTDHAICASADAVGAYIGRKIFSWVGTAIGAACGNPVVAYAGYFIGRRVGSAAGSAAASIGAAWVMDRFVTCCAMSNSTLELNENYVISINDPNNLTDGELHNLILVELLKNINKYVLSDGSLNYHLLVNDAYMYENQFSPIENFAIYKEQWIPLAVEQTKRIVNASELLVYNNSDVFLNVVYNTLIPEVQISKEEFDNANLLNEKVLSTYIMLDDATLVEFSKEIDSVIESSELNIELKNELKVSNSVLTNSSLIWREVH